jgi:hypothetical protein
VFSPLLFVLCLVLWIEIASMLPSDVFPVLMPVTRAAHPAAEIFLRPVPVDAGA